MTIALKILICVKHLKTRSSTLSTLWEVNVVPVDACGTYSQVQMSCTFTKTSSWLHGFVEYGGIPGVYSGSRTIGNRLPINIHSYEKSSTCLKQSLWLPMLCSGQAQQVYRVFTANPSGWNSHWCHCCWRFFHGWIQTTWTPIRSRPEPVLKFSSSPQADSHMSLAKTCINILRVKCNKLYLCNLTLLSNDSKASKA